MLLYHLCDFGSWPLTLREGHKLMMFEDRVRRDILGAKGLETAGNWRKLQDEMLRTCAIHQILFA